MKDVKIEMYSPASLQISLFEQVQKNLYPEDDLSLVSGKHLNTKNMLMVFIVSDKNNPVGRAVVYDHPEIQLKGERTLLIGNYECSDDHEISGQLMAAVKEFAVKNGASCLIGPMDGSTWNNYRFCVTRKENPFFMEPFHHAYYPSQFEQNGFTTLADYISSKQDEITPMSDRIYLRKTELEKTGVIFRNFKMSAFEGELEKIFNLTIEAFKDNFLYAGISLSDFISLYEKARSYIDPQYVFLAEHDEKTVGFLFAIPDYLNKNQKGIIIKTLARHHSDKFKGIGNILSAMANQQAMATHCDYILHALMIHDNASVKVSQSYTGKVISNYKLYIYHL